MHKMQPTTASRVPVDPKRSGDALHRTEVRTQGGADPQAREGQAVGGHDDRPTPDGIAAVTQDTVCTLCGQYGHRASHCPHNEPAQHTSRARIWPFGPDYVGIVAAQFLADKPGTKHQGKPCEVVGNTPSNNAKFAPKKPKAGKPLAGNRAPKGAA